MKKISPSKDRKIYRWNIGKIFISGNKCSLEPKIVKWKILVPIFFVHFPIFYPANHSFHLNISSRRISLKYYPFPSTVSWWHLHCKYRVKNVILGFNKYSDSWGKRYLSWMHLPRPDAPPTWWPTRWLLDDQIAPGDQIDDQITAVTRLLLGN